MKEFTTFNDVDYIVVHGGRCSHQDEQVACALAVAFGAKNEILRRDPTPEEIANPHVLVMDIGMTLDPETRVFDHHQLPREQADCAYSLLAKYLGCYEALASIHPWFKAGVVIDQQGPYEAAKLAGTTWEQIEGLVSSPARKRHDDKWASDDDYRSEAVADLAAELKADLEVWPTLPGVTREESVGEVKAIVADLNVTKDQDRLLTAWAKANKADVLIGKDDRGPGLMLLRIANSPRLDFAPLSGREGVVFSHQGGFILKTTTTELSQAVTFIKEATVRG